MKTHVAYAALELAVAKLGQYDPHNDDLTLRAKRLLQKCAHAMISHQELSAQLVCTYLMDFEDHFTSHSFRKLYWTSFEAYINEQQPSPECYILKKKDHEENAEPDTENELLNADNTNDIQEQTDIPDCESPSNSRGVHEFEEDEIAEDEVIISSDDKGEIMARASQVTDYRLRSTLCKNLTLWDFIAQVDKTKSTSKNAKPPDFPDSESDTDTDDVQSDASGLEVRNADKSGNSPLSANQIRWLLHSHSRTRPKYDLKNNHPEWQKFQLQIRRHSHRFVTVPIGPHIPRRDKKNQYPKFCRLMLIFFKPWQDVADLREDGQSWPNVFCEFMRQCPSEF